MLLDLSFELLEYADKLEIKNLLYGQCIGLHKTL